MSRQDCFICGHPILEGQKVSRSVLHSDSPPNHMNPADHLPTLSGLIATPRLEELIQSHRDEVEHLERERAAKMAEELSARLQRRDKDEEAPISEEWHRGWDSAVEWIDGLAAKIRGNDE